jgi:hypothetical protein
MAGSLRDRVAALEQEMARLKRQGLGARTGREWVDDLYGKFAGDPIFKRAMKLGRDYRKSLRPKARKGKPQR